MRNWRKYWHSYGIHWLQGGICGALALHFPACSFGFLSLCVAYQFAGYIKKQDTVALDIKDITIGYFIGGTLCVLHWALA